MNKQLIRQEKQRKNVGCLGTVAVILIAIILFFFIIPGCNSGYNKAKQKSQVESNAKQYSEKEYKQKCQAVSYDKISRDTDAMKGKFFKFTGEILQEIEDGKYRLGINDNNDSVVIDYSGTRLLEDDKITVYGESLGFVEYETVLGKRMKVPEISVVYIVTGKSDVDVKNEQAKAEKVPVKKLGETWIVEGKWKLKITSVKETKERSKYADTDPNVVYIIDYTYENLGCSDGLYIDFSQSSFVDSKNNVGEIYFYADTKDPQNAPVGAKCKAQIAVGLETPGNFKIHFSDYDDNANEHKAVFNLKVQ